MLNPARLLRRMLPANGLLAVGLCLVGAVSLAALLAPWLAPYDPLRR